MSDRIPMTKVGYDKLKTEVDRFELEEMPEIAKRIAAARSEGDLSENAEYHEARKAQAELEARIREIEQLLANAKVVSKSSKKDEVTIGSKVTLQKKGDGTVVYELVGAAEADILENKISNESPLGQALLGKKKGDSFEFETPAGKVEYKVLSVE